MAKIVNKLTDYQGLLIPGSPVVFSVKGDGVSRVDLSTVVTRYGLTGVSHRVVDGQGVPPQLANLPATVSVSSPERVQPFSYETSCTPDGAGIRISGGVGSAVAGVFEVSAPIPVRGAVMSSVTIEWNTSWATSSRPWFNNGQLLPLYLGLEYGPTNTGIFVGFENSGTGKLIVGGPYLGSTSRPGQQLSPDIGWLALADLDRVTVVLTIDEANDEAFVLYQVNSGPLDIALELPASSLGQFADSSSGISQWRDVASQEVRAFFGHGGEPAVTFLDYQVFPYAPRALNGGEAGVYHTVKRRPDLPILYRVEETGLPTSELLSRWDPLPGQTPQLTSYYLPGKPSAPYQAVLSKTSGAGVMGLSREEPQLTQSNSFLLDADVSVENVVPAGHNTGIGFDVHLASAKVSLRFLQVGAERYLGVLQDGGDPDSSAGYYLSSSVNWNSPFRLRVVYAANVSGNRVLSLYAGDVLVGAFEAPSLPSTSTPGFVDLGHLDTGDYAGELCIASITYTNEIISWESESSLPTGVATGTVTQTASQAMRVSKTGDDLAYYALDRTCLYQRGELLEFKAKVTSYSDSLGTMAPPNVWTGAGATIFFGSAETPDNTIRKMHLGFFDCGVFGKKVAILPGAGGASDVLRQTTRGRSHSVSMDWTAPHSYRLIYLPNDRIEVWVDQESVPSISLSWAKFFAERDPTAPDTPSLAFGFFNPSVRGTAEFTLLRHGLSTGYEFVVTQDPTLGGVRETNELSNGSELSIFDAEDVVP